MNKPSPNPSRKSRLSSVWDALYLIAFLAIIFGLYVVPLYMGSWRFSTWLREVFSTLWPVAAIVSGIAMFAALATKEHDTKEAYRWMRGAAWAALLSVLMLWLTVRDKL